MAPWLVQEKNRKQEELDDWLTFPVHAVAVDPEAVVLTVSCACGEYDERPDGCPRFHPTGTVNRAELRYLAGSPKRFVCQKKRLFDKNIHKCGEEERERSTNLSVASNFDWLVFVPGIGQVSRFGERKLPPGRKNK